jgi:DNA polymerase IV
MSVACFVLPQFGIACERKRTPDLAGLPLVLTGEDGTVCVASDEAAHFGIREGQKVSGARALCSDLCLRPYDLPAYEADARDAWDLLAIESSFVEPESPEVCFVGFDGREIAERCRLLAGQLREHAGVPVQVGLARTKLMARVAARRTGEETLACVPAGCEGDFLAPIPVEEVPEIDPRLAQELQKLGVRTLGHVAGLPERELRRRFRDRGLVLSRLARGGDAECVRALWPPRSVEHAVRFEEEVDDAERLHAALKHCADQVAEALGATREYCRTLTLEVRFDTPSESRVASRESRVTTQSAPGIAAGRPSSTPGGQATTERGEKLQTPTATPADVHRAALRLFGRMTVDRPVIEIRLHAGDIGVAGGLQLTLLDENEHAHGLPHERANRLEAAFRRVRRRFGAGTVQTAAALNEALRISLWTDPLGHRMDEPVQVEADSGGAPMRYWWRGRLREVAHVQNHWRETEWVWGRQAERTVFRVETVPLGICELRHTGGEWRLVALAD